MTRLLMTLYNRRGKGTYWRALGFAQELVKHEYDVTLLAVSSDQKLSFCEQNVNGVRVVATPALMPGSGYDLWDVMRRIGWVRKESFDLVHAFESRPVAIFPALFVQRRHHAPLLIDWCDWFGRGGSVEERENRLIRGILRPVETFFEEHYRPRAAGVTVINTILQQKARSLGIPAEHLLLLPNGANIHDIRPQSKRVVRERLGLPQDIFILGYTGAMFNADARLMAAAFDAIYAQAPQIRLLLIGYGTMAVEQMVKAPEAVLRTGPVSYQQLADYMAACDIGWLPLSATPANQGRFPLKVHDFMAAGRPLIVSNVGDLGDFVRRWEIGWSAPAEPAAMVQTVMAGMRAAADLNAIGQHARNIAENEFSWAIVTQKLIRFYQEIMGRRAASG